MRTANILTAVILSLLPGLAFAQSPLAGPGAPPFTKYKNFGGNVAGVSGNGTDLTEDPLTNCNLTIPAGILANVGDVVQITLGGSFGATTDTKTLRVRQTSIAGTVLSSTAATAVSAIRWGLVLKFIKTASNAQTVNTISSVGSGAFTGTNTITTANTDSATIPIVVSGQNVTNSVASSVTCLFSQMEFFGAN
jgi:hypothetical protein